MLYVYLPTYIYHIKTCISIMLFFENYISAMNNIVDINE